MHAEQSAAKLNLSVLFVASGPADSVGSVPPATSGAQCDTGQRCQKKITGEHP